MRSQSARGFGRLLVREVTERRSYAPLEGHRVRPVPEPVWVVVGLEDHRVRPAQEAQGLGHDLPEIGRQSARPPHVRDAQSVGRGIVRHLEEGRADVAAQVQGFADVYRGGAFYGLGYPGRRIHRHLVLTEERTDAAGMVVVAVGQEHGGDVREVSPDPGQKPLQAPTRESGVDEKTPSASLKVSRVA